MVDKLKKQVTNYIYREDNKLANQHRDEMYKKLSQAEKEAEVLAYAMELLRDLTEAEEKA